MAYDRSLLRMRLKQSWVFTEEEIKQATESLSRNGIVVIENFLDPDTTEGFARQVERSLDAGRNAGYANFATLEPVHTAASIEFHHPFAVSSTATAVVTNRQILDLAEAYVGEQVRIHSAIFQKTFPLKEGCSAVDWHVDCGANKQLNGATRFADKRLRSILYLSDVDDGGLGYILDSREARDVFLAQPEGALFPPERVPDDPGRRIEVLSPKGTLLLFDTHGLHRPSPLKTNRLVMNVWFCGKSFRAQLPPILLQAANLPAGAEDSLYVFATAPDFEGKSALMMTPTNPVRLMVRRLLRRANT